MGINAGAIDEDIALAARTTFARHNRRAGGRGYGLMHYSGIRFRENARTNSSFDLCKGNRVHFDIVEMRLVNALDSTNYSDFARAPFANSVDCPLRVLGD